LLGRDEEQGRLAGRIASACQGHGGALVIRGEAGVGKSALLASARDSAGDCIALEARGVEAEAELPFAALADLLAPLIDRTARLPRARAAALRGALRLSDAAVADRFAVYAAVRELLVAAARDRPVVALVDDAHWLDAATHDALLFATRRLEDARVAVVMTAREGWGHELRQPWLEQVELQGLPAESGVTLAQRVKPSIAASVARTLHDGTGGNPLAIVEIAAALRPAQLAGREALPAPLPVGPALQAVFETRLAGLPEPTRAALTVAAASQTGRADVIAAALRAEGRDADALHPAEEAGLVGLTDGVIGWRHPLVRSAAYHAAPAPARRAAHRALAAVASGDTLEDHRAWHLAAAAEAPDEEVAQALDELAAAAAHRGGLAVVERALEAAARLTPSNAARGARLLRAADAAIVMGHSARALELLDDALRCSSDARFRAHLERLHARADVIRGVPQTAHQRLVAEAARWERSDPGLAAELLCEAVVADMTSDDPDRYLATARRALDNSRRAGTEGLPGILLGIGLTAIGAGPAAVEILDRYAPVAENPSLWPVGPEMVGMLALAWIWTERYAEAERLLDAVTASARASGGVRALAFPLIVQAELKFRSGRWGTAVQMAAEAVELSEDVGEGALLANNLSYLARIKAATGEVDESRSYAERGLAIAHELDLGAIKPYLHSALAQPALAVGRYDEVLVHLEALYSEKPPFAGDPGLGLWDGDLAEAYVRVGDIEAAGRRLADYEEKVARTGRTLGHAVVARVRGMLAGEDEFDANFEEALRWHELCPMPLERARTELYLGERLRRARRRGEARRHLSTALSTFERLGAALWAQRALHELRAAGARDQAADSDDPWSELTPQEARVAEAALSGATYKEMAESFVLSPRTIEHHLRQAYRKLGVRSRTELAMRLNDAPPSRAPADR
jgi:DNA-binding CsgD family transcriptional regulator